MLRCAWKAKTCERKLFDSFYSQREPRTRNPRTWNRFFCLIFFSLSRPNEPSHHAGEKIHFRMVEWPLFSFVLLTHSVSVSPFFPSILNRILAIPFSSSMLSDCEAHEKHQHKQISLHVNTIRPSLGFRYHGYFIHVSLCSSTHSVSV